MLLVKLEVRIKRKKKNKMNIILNISDHISYIKNNTRLETITKVYNECVELLSYKIMNGQLDPNKEDTLFLCTRYGAVTVTIIPRDKFN